MKNLILIAALSTLSATSNAFHVTEFCENLIDYAGSVMTSRQYGASMTTVLGNVNFDNEYVQQDFTRVVSEAYDFFVAGEDDLFWEYAIAGYKLRVAVECGAT